MHEHDEQDEHEREEPPAAEDLDVPESDSEDVKGGAEPAGNYSFKQAWPKKYSG